MRGAEVDGAEVDTAPEEKNAVNLQDDSLPDPEHDAEEDLAGGLEEKDFEVERPQAKNSTSNRRLIFGASLALASALLLALVTAKLLLPIKKPAPPNPLETRRVEDLDEDLRTVVEGMLTWAEELEAPKGRTLYERDLGYASHDDGWSSNGVQYRILGLFTELTPAYDGTKAAKELKERIFDLLKKGAEIEAEARKGKGIERVQIPFPIPGGGGQFKLCLTAWSAHNTPEWTPLGV